MLSYVSTCKLASANKTSELAKIVETSRTLNKKRHITGALFLDQTHFFQAIEGPSDAIRTLFESIRADPRHENVSILLDEPTDQRRFSDWSMECFYDPTPKTFATPVGNIFEKCRQRLMTCQCFNSCELSSFVWTLVGDMSAHQFYPTRSFRRMA